MSRSDKSASQSLPPLTRKLPHQARARATVEKIKRAATELIDEEGYAYASTNRIAKRAGVNIATLYRYFPNRESLALTLLEEAAAHLAEVTHKHLQRTMDWPLEESMRPLLELMVDTIEQHRVSLLILPEEVQEIRQRAQPLSLENLAYERSVEYFRHQLGELDEKVIKRKLYFVQHMGMGVIRRFVLDRRPLGLTRAQFVDELTHIVVLYLRSGYTA